MFFRQKHLKHPNQVKTLVPRISRCIDIFPYEDKFSLGNLSIHRQCLRHFYLARAINIKNKGHKFYRLKRQIVVLC